MEPMIRRIVIEGVRTHEHTEIELGRMTCLVGPNGCGKSTVLASFGALLGKEPPSWLRANSPAWTMEIFGDNGTKLAVVQSSSRVKPALRVVDLRMNAAVLREPSLFKDAHPAMESDGGQLAAVLASWKLADFEKFTRTLHQLRQVVPALVDITPATTKLRDLPAFEVFFDFISAPRIPASAVSEGTLLTLGLLAALNEVETSEELATIVLLDDIDRGLHPDAQKELIGLLRGIADIKDLQIVLTTHSPYIVDAMAAEEVCVLALDPEGTTRARKLSDIPGEKRLRGMLSTGELWSSHGESWVLDQPNKSATMQ